MPMRRDVLMTRQAISPRLAIKILFSIGEGLPGAEVCPAVALLPVPAGRRIVCYRQRVRWDRTQGGSIKLAFISPAGTGRHARQRAWRGSRLTVDDPYCS